MGRSGRTGAGKPTVSSTMRAPSPTAPKAAPSTPSSGVFGATRPAAAPASATATATAARPAPAAPAPAPAAQHHAPAPAPAASHGPAPVVVQGPGILANIASTAAGSAMGHVVGRGISEMIFGGGSKSEAPAAEAAPAAAAAAPQGAFCMAEDKEFKKCLEQNGSENIAACQFYYQMLMQCRNGMKS